MRKNKGTVGFEFTHDAHLAALYAKRRELGRNDLTEDEWNAVVDKTNARIAAGEDPLDLLEEYGNMYMTDKAGGDEIAMEYLTVEEAAAILKVRENTIRDWLKSGKLKGHKIGRIWRLTEEAISEFVEREGGKGGKA